MHRRYDRAQTPMQRLLATDIVSETKRQELTRITQALDPLRLLQQLEQLQKALFRHAQPPRGNTEQSGPTALQSFSVRQCAEEGVPRAGLPGTPPALLKRERKRRSQRSGRPHDWRTRKDPFEGTWEEITNWLRAQPDLTAADIFRRLQQRYPGRFRETQVRTLRRGISKLRAHLLVTFDDQWNEEVVNGSSLVPELRAEILTGLPSEEDKIGIICSPEGVGDAALDRRGASSMRDPRPELCIDERLCLGRFRTSSLSPPVKGQARRHRLLHASGASTLVASRGKPQASPEMLDEPTGSSLQRGGFSV